MNQNSVYAITSAGTKKGELFFADVNTQLKNKNVTTDIKWTDSNLFTTITVDEPAPVLKAIFSFRVPDQMSGKIELQYLHEYAGISSSIGLTANPVVNFSGVLGTNVLALGTDISFDTKTRNFTKCNTGLSFSNVDLIASLALVDPCFHMGPIASQPMRTPSGTQHAIDPLTMVKARVNNVGMASAVIQHEWRPKSLFTISGEVDTKSIDKSPKVGLALALKP
ncbi:putative auxin efflux carrier component 1b-like [Hibiscus syriacus]|uniref:Auxin efflux carrier component 1b-like n=1 Tax=Hibiscus syriacus TaxID=106335 RepID=A0A6A2ZJ45_HIBSY|nr:putative auxin efflux carrier component 1b-like [Hibiscus syriacus]